MIAIDLSHVTKIYRKGFRAIKVPAIVDCSFSVREGSVTGFAGPNGAGKTTTIKLLMGLVFPTSGKITIYGMTAVSPASRKHVAFLSEQPYFYNHLTVQETLKFHGRLLGIAPAVLSRRTGEILEDLQLAEKKNTRVRELSKGLQQRLNMASVLIGDFSLFVLDEPMSGMDPPGRALFRSVFRRLKLSGKTIFFSTHVLEDIESVCDEVVVLSKGRLSYSGGVRDLLDKGFSGTEITVPVLSPAVRSLLQSKGLSITNSPECDLIHLPQTCDNKTVLEELYRNGVFPSGIQRRTRPLEELLYDGGRL